MSTVAVSDHQQLPAELWGEWLASRPAGQLVFRAVDSVLRLIEKTLMWSTQSTSKSRVGSDAGEASECGGPGQDGGQVESMVLMPRPLAWPLLLPLLGVLGVVRVTVYSVSRIIRRPCSTTDVVHWLQCKRRRLRAIKYAGIKNMRAQLETKPTRTPNGTPHSKPLQTPDQERKRKYDDVEQSDWTDNSDDESVAVKLEKYGEDYDSESDPDFVPKSDDDSSEDEDASASEDEVEDGEEGAVPVNDSDVNDPTSVAEIVTSPSIVSSPSIVTVESPQSAHLQQNQQSALEVV